jgi:hypothetical protein
VCCVCALPTHAACVAALSQMEPKFLRNQARRPGVAAAAAAGRAPAHQAAARATPRAAP